MTTLAAMIAEIESDTERSDTAAIRNKIQAAIRRYQSKRLWFNESRNVTFTTVAGTKEYAFSTIGEEFYQIDDVFLTDGSTVYELEKVNYTDIEAMAGDATQAVPQSYGYINRALLFYPTPADAYTVRLTGHIKIDGPSSDDETNNLWMTEAYDLIQCRAKAELYAHRWEDPNNAALMRIAEQDALSRLLSATYDKVAPGYLEATDF